MKINQLSEETTMKLDPSVMSKIITPELNRLHEVFTSSGFEIRIVGGAVRDLILGKIPKDIDLATNATPQEMINILDRFKIHHIETGLQHGTITAIINKIPFEITTLRIDVETDGRHAKVEYTRSFKLDAERRDLTMNAMSLSFEGTLYDYYDGLKDLKNSAVRFVGDADKRIKEDYLRILRYFRFSQRLKGNPIDDATKEAIRINAAGLKNISGERIWSEMKKILEGPAVTKSLQLMCELGVADYIGMPCRDDIDHLTELGVRGATAIGLLSVLLENEQEVQAIVAHWKLANPERDELVWLVNNSKIKLTQEMAEDLAIYGVNRDWINQLSILQNKNSIGSSVLKWKMPTFPVSGKDLMDIGIKAGPEMGKILKNLKAAWVHSRFKLTRDQLLQSVELNEGIDNKSTVHKFEDGEFRFYTAYYGSWAGDKRIVFRVRTDSNPQKRAEEKDIKYYDRLMPATPYEIEAWLKSKYPRYQLT